VAVTVDWLVSSVVHGSHGGGHRGVDSVVGNGVGKKRGSMNSVSNNGGSMVSRSHNRGSMVSWSNNWGSVVSWSNNGGSMVSGSNLDDGSCLVGWGWLVVSWGRGRRIRLGLGVDGSSLVSHLSNIAVIAVGGVGHLLDPAVGKSHSVGSLDIAGTVGGLLSVEVGLGVVISHGVGEGVGGDLIRVFLGLVGGGGLVSSGSWLVSNRGRGISWGSVDNRCVVSDGMGNNGDMMSDWVNRMVGNWVDKGGMMSDSVVDSVVGDRGNRVERDHSSLASWDDPVGSNGGLDLRQTLGVVHLAH